VRECRHGVLREPGVEAGVLLGERREQWLRQPAPQERFEPVALQLVGELLVGIAADGPLGGVGDAGRAADQDQADDDVRPVEGEAQAEPAAARVARVHGPPAGVAEGVRGGGEVEPGGHVERDDLVGVCVVAPELGGSADRARRSPSLRGRPRDAERGPDRVPGRRGLREPGHQHQSHPFIFSRGSGTVS
jgi:hypothetical protein